MSLIVPPFQFANITDNLPSTPGTTNSSGTAITANANNTDSTPVTLLSALAHDVHWINFVVAPFSASAADAQCLLDILTDPAGGTSWGSFIDDLVCGQTNFFSSGGLQWYNFPIWIPAGTSVGVRARTKHTANLSGRILINALGNPSRPEAWWCGQKVESLGIDPSTSSGTVITPGATGAAGTWTSVGSVTSARYGAIQLGINGSDATAVSAAYHFEVGYGSTPLPGAPKRVVIGNTTEQHVHWNAAIPVFCDIAEGTQMQARATSSNAGEDWNVGIYGVY